MLFYKALGIECVVRLFSCIIFCFGDALHSVNFDGAMLGIRCQACALPKSCIIFPQVPGILNSLWTFILSHELSRKSCHQILHNSVIHVTNRSWTYESHMSTGHCLETSNLFFHEKGIFRPTALFNSQLCSSWEEALDILGVDSILCLDVPKALRRMCQPLFSWQGKINRFVVIYFSHLSPVKKNTCISSSEKTKCFNLNNGIFKETGIILGETHFRICMWHFICLSKGQPHSTGSAPTSRGFSLHLSKIYRYAAYVI